MPPVDASLRPFEPGTTGWSAADLDDPQVQRRWSAGRYEIIDGVLTMMAPAYFTGSEALFNLMTLCRRHTQDHGIKGSFGAEADIVLDETRVVVADAVFMTPQDKHRQEKAAVAAGRGDVRRTRILVPPTLVIESVSPGHEQHDLKTKMRWYAEFGVPNYWILNAFEKSLACRVLDGAEYRIDASGRDQDELRTSAFPGLTISLADVWQE